MSYTVRQKPAHAGNYTAGRTSKVNKIVLHHAATTDFNGIARTFQAAGRNASAHYGVSNGVVDQYVSENDTAWHAGNWNANVTSIGIEHVNSSGAPNWEVADGTIRTSIELIRDIAKRHGLLPLKVGVNLFQHKDFSPTYCAGRVGEKLQFIADRVNAGTSPAPAKNAGKKSNETIANEVIAGAWGNGDDRVARLRAAGYNPQTIQNIVNAKYGAAPAPAPARKSNETIANEVIAGAWGNGPERITRLQNAGYNATTIQNIVNAKYGAAPAPAPAGITVGSKVVVTNPVDVNGTRLGTSGVYDVMQVNGDRIVIGRGGVVTAAINRNNLRRA